MSRQRHWVRVFITVSGSNPRLQCHRPVKRRSLSNSSRASAKPAREGVQVPSLPQLRALQQETSGTPESGSSLPSIPRSGQNRPHPYGSVGEASADTFYEVVSSLATRAPGAIGTDNSMETTPDPYHPPHCRRQYKRQGEWKSPCEFQNDGFPVFRSGGINQVHCIGGIVKQGANSTLCT